MSNPLAVSRLSQDDLSTPPMPATEHPAATATRSKSVANWIAYAKTPHSTSGAYSRVIDSRACTRRMGSRIQDKTGSTNAALPITRPYRIFCAWTNPGLIGRTTQHKWEAINTERKLADVLYRFRTSVTSSRAIACSSRTWSSAKIIVTRPTLVGTTMPGANTAVCRAALKIRGRIAVSERSSLVAIIDPLWSIREERLQNRKRVH